jgi:integrase
MASIVRLDAAGNVIPAKSKVRPDRYRVRYRSPEGDSRSKTFGRLVDAEAFLTQVEHSKLVGEYVDSKAARVTFGEYALRWAEAQPHRATTAEGVESILRRHVLPTFGGRQLSAIRTSDVQAWVSSLVVDVVGSSGEVERRGLAPSTVVTVYGKVAAIFRAAVEDRLIARSPCTRRVRLPRQDGAEVVPMEPEQVRAMVEAVGARYRALVVLLAGTGLRPGEALGLTVDRVDFLRRTIRVDRQLITMAGEAPRFGPCKTAASVRTVPAPDAVLAELARHLEQFPTGALGLIFTDSKGDPIRRNALGHLWRRAAGPAGVEGFTPHDLRHYAASVLIDQGASVKAVQRHLGHGSATTTLDTYAHLWPDAEDTTRRALAAGLAHVVSFPCHPATAEA